MDTTADARQKLSGGSEPPASAPFLLKVFDCERPRTPPEAVSLAALDGVHLGRGDAWSTTSAEAGWLDLRVADRWMSSKHLRLIGALGTWFYEDLGSKNGTVVNGRRSTQGKLRDGDLVELGRTFFVFRSALDAEALAVERSRPTAMRTLLPELSTTFTRVEQIAPTEVPILLEGESGAGKEVVARAIHELSERRGDFVPVNCGAIPDTLVESELFGHQRGAFSGAQEDRLGLVRAADGGTLFLDEIAELPLPSQVALLRILQEREVRPVGATKSVPVDVRYVAATHGDLAARVADGRFRHDLYARLAGLNITLPSLRRRSDDIGLLVGALLDRIAPDVSVTFEPEAARCLFRHDWPFNVRELETTLRTSVVFAAGKSVEVEHLPEALRPLARGEGGEGGEDVNADESEEGKRRLRIVTLLREHEGNVSAVARALGKHRRQLQRWIKRYGIRPSDYQ